ncbi:ABC transporter permease [Campylobacter insulaenigrae]|uniref:Ferrirhodotorulic acid ABC transporter, permease protein n=1 Tax=Campylobacter insulaenigrae NCTC 12927 TaxID=1031564 RepID=A0A0A8H297_9BACT|nr:ABC transporter permease [Campylobacter insulaenigrae]AJC88092.1 ferrirhodotorulic acid ABC transporter, permease protein [Campylobacter insulaenigrae NCTC 12927]MCR6591635.1 ABC transporter permease [Campylobacter insulaenigrae]MCR6592900.1 ABC transporter permease [Campylobacter insulaenigrae]VEH94806.1 ABC transporter permease [Campylobacter insulaenigrae]VEJ54780.1 ABC transporter permease [Campylobacter insulaenigrae]
MQVKIIKNSIFQNKIQKSLALFTIFLATLLIATMLNLTLGIGNELAKELRSYGSNILVLPKGASLSIEVGNKIYEPLKNQNFLEEDKLHTIKEIFWRNNINAFSPFLNSQIDVKIQDKNINNISLLGTYFNKAIKIQDDDDFYAGIEQLYKYSKIEGVYPQDDSLDEIIVGKELAEKYHLNLNDEIELIKNEKRFKVKIVAIISLVDEFSNKIIASLLLSQKLLDKEGLFAKAEVSALTIPENDLAQKARRDVSSLDQLEYDHWYCTAYVSSIAYQIAEDFKGASTKVISAISDAESLIVSKIQSLMMVISIICLIVASIAISSLMSADIYRRKSEIGLLKALGASILQIYMIFVLEGVIIAIIGAILGFICGVVISEFIALSIFSHSVDISWIILPLCIFFAILIIFLGCLLSIKSISKLSTSEVLYGK